MNPRFEVNIKELARIGVVIRCNAPHDVFSDKKRSIGTASCL
jgi:hypothetical protein